MYKKTLTREALLVLILEWTFLENVCQLGPGRGLVSVGRIRTGVRQRGCVRTEVGLVPGTRSLASTADRVKVDGSVHRGHIPEVAKHHVSEDLS